MEPVTEPQAEVDAWLAEMKADREVRTAEEKAYGENLMALFETDQGKTEARLEKGQEQSRAEIETDLEEVEVTDVEANPVETAISLADV
jgi:hypothetical protein